MLIILNKDGFKRKLLVEVQLKIIPWNLHKNSSSDPWDILLTEKVDSKEVMAFLNKDSALGLVA